MIKDAVRWEDHTVNVFDESMNELVEYCGAYRDKCYSVIHHASDETEFWHGVKKHMIRKVDREHW